MDSLSFTATAGTSGRFVPSSDRFITTVKQELLSGVEPERHPCRDERGRLSYLVELHPSPVLHVAGSRGVGRDHTGHS
jgi:hypothetical protein